jgi:hypothetical protein
MAFLSGKNNNFKFHFPKIFVPEEIEKKYTPLLKTIPGCMCETVIDFINFSIKNVQLQVNPNNYEPIEQVDRATPYGRISRSDAVPDFLWKKDMTIAFQLDSMYLIWFILCDLFIHYYVIKEKYLPKPPGMEILDMYDRVVYRVTFEDLLFTGIDGLEFDYSSNEIDQKLFNTTWKANKVDIVLEPSRI